MPANATTTTASGTVTPGKRRRGFLVPAVVLAVALLGAGYTIGGKPKDSGTTATTTPDEKVKAPAPLLELDPAIVTLADGRFIKLGLALELSEDKADEKLLKASEGESEEAGRLAAPAMDAAISVLGQLTAGQLTGTGGREALRRELLTMIGPAMNDAVTGVLFTEFIVQ